MGPIRQREVVGSSDGESAGLVRTDRHNHHPIAGDTQDVKAVKVLARPHQNLIWVRNRNTNALRSALRAVLPGRVGGF